MASPSKEQKRAKRAKAKAKELRIARNNPHTPAPIVPDYFMPDFAPFEEDEDDAEQLQYMDEEFLADLDEEEVEDMKALLSGDLDGISTEDQMLLDEVYEQPAQEPSAEQRMAHFQELKQAEREGRDALLLAFVKGPVAAHALFDINFADYAEILLGTIGAYWMWSEGIDEQTARDRIVNDEFYEAMRDALGQAEEDAIERMLGIDKKSDASPQD